MRKLSSLGSIGLVVVLGAIGCSSSDDSGGELPDAGGADVTGIDVTVDQGADVQIDSPSEAAPDGGADADAATDAQAEADAPAEAEAEAEACTPSTFDCALFSSVVDPDAGADAGTTGPGVTIGIGNGDVIITLAPGTPVPSAATLTLGYSDGIGYCTDKTAEVPVQVSGSTLTVKQADLPADLADVCGISTLHLTDGCGTVTDLSIDVSHFVLTETQGVGTLGGIPTGFQVACLDACTANQWEAAVTKHCSDCPAPDLQCWDVAMYGGADAELSFDAATGLVTITLASGAAEVTSATLKIDYQDGTTYECGHIITVPLTVSNGVLTGTIPALPADYSSFSSCTSTIEVVQKCGSTQSFDVYPYVAEPDGDIEFNFSCAAL